MPVSGWNVDSHCAHRGGRYKLAADLCPPLTNTLPSHSGLHGPLKVNRSPCGVCRYPPSPSCQALAQHTKPYPPSIDAAHTCPLFPFAPCWSQRLPPITFLAGKQQGSRRKGWQCRRWLRRQVAHLVKHLWTLTKKIWPAVRRVRARLDPPMCRPANIGG